MATIGRVRIHGTGVDVYLLGFGHLRLTCCQCNLERSHFLAKRQSLLRRACGRPPTLNPLSAGVAVSAGLSSHAMPAHLYSLRPPPPALQDAALYRSCRSAPAPVSTAGCRRSRAWGALPHCEHR